MKDILDIEESVYNQERKKLVKKGWSAKLFALQDKDGLWNGSLYNGKWISTTYTLYLLKIFGLPPFNDQALAACDQLFTRGIFNQREIRFSRNQEHQDLGVTGLVLSLCCYFGYEQKHLHSIVDYLVKQQHKEGNWLPNHSEAAAAYTFETTLIVLEGLLQYSKQYSSVNAEAKGQEYLMKHNLYLNDGKAIKSKWTSFSFPSYWFYDVLTSLDYFQKFGKNKDKRIQRGIELVVEKQNKDDTWDLGSRHPGKTYFDMEKSREPSRWNTLRALRVLKWWNNGI